MVRGARLTVALQVQEATLRELIEAGRVLLVQEGRRKEIHVNPALIKGGEIWPFQP